MNPSPYERDTLVDAVPSISLDESEMLAAILFERERNGCCEPFSVCPSWAHVRALVSLRDRAMVVVFDCDIRLTPVGREWAEAFSRFSPNNEPSNAD